MPKYIDRLDEIFEVSLGENQKGWMWAKLSPKSKAQIQSIILEERLEELDNCLKFCENNTNKKPRNNYTTKERIKQRIAYLHRKQLKSSLSALSGGEDE